MKRALLVAALLVPLATWSSPVFAQNTQTGFIHGLGGLTFTEQAAGAFGAGAGYRVSPTLFAFGEFGRMQDVMPAAFQSELDAMLGDIDPNVTMEVSVPALYGFGGVRWMVPTSGSFAPFVEAGIGFAKLSANATYTGFGATGSASIGIETDLMTVLGGGVVVPVASRLDFEVGIRYARIFITDMASNNFKGYGGIAYRF